MPRALRPLAALAIVALLSAGCSNAAAHTGTGGSAGDSTTNRDQAVRFAGCMRKNGVREFPDPNESGELTIDGLANGSSLDPSSAAFKQATAACKDLEPPGFMGHKRSAQEQEAALKFARCIRDNGVKDFPDPTEDSPLVDTRRIPSAAGDGISRINAAMQKCRDLAADAGAVGAR